MIAMGGLVSHTVGGCPKLQPDRAGKRYNPARDALPGVDLRHFI
jgi:hypothetical protein